MNPLRPTPSIALPDLVPLEGLQPRLLVDASGSGTGVRGWLACGVRRSLTIGSASSDAFQQVEAFVGAAEGRCFGWIGYDQLRGDALLDLPHQSPTSVPLPVVHWVEPEGVLCFDTGKGTSVWLHEPADPELQARMESALRGAASPAVRERRAGKPGEVGSSLDRDHYLSSFRKVHGHILRGDIYELNLCRELHGILPEDWSPAEAFAHLTDRTRAPYSAWMSLGDVHILSASPECFLERTGQRLRSRPIKGTAPRHGDPARDALEAERLRTDPKERAENIMITDLVRNDLSRVAARASVEVEELCGIHSFRNVHQMVSTVACQVREDASFADILQATFPMGSMTGAPKLRAMEITAEVEPVMRGLYSGTIGWADPDGRGNVGDFHLNVVIRTVLADLVNRRWSAHVGGAITALAQPENEWEETRLKARALLEVLGAEPALQPPTEVHG